MFDENDKPDIQPNPDAQKELIELVDKRWVTPQERASYILATIQKDLYQKELKGALLYDITCFSILHLNQLTQVLDNPRVEELIRELGRGLFASHYLAPESTIGSADREEWPSYGLQQKQENSDSDATVPGSDSGNSGESSDPSGESPEIRLQD